MKVIPFQQYRRILNRLEENVTTKQVRHTLMRISGEESRMMVDCVDTQVALEDQKDKLPSKNEIKRACTTKILPLKKITPKERLFNKVIKSNLESMQGSMFLDAIFIHFWREGKSIAIRRAFLPFLAYFVLANYYYTQRLMYEVEDFTYDWTDSEFLKDFTLYVTICLMNFQQLLRILFQVIGEKSNSDSIF